MIGDKEEDDPHQEAVALTQGEEGETGIMIGIEEEVIMILRDTEITQEIVEGEADPEALLTNECLPKEGFIILISR